jgi:glycosyltransferase involved in cell wall biosynthesis
MKIGLVNNWSPFTVGGAELLVQALHKELSKKGHQAFIVRVPLIINSPSDILTQALAPRLMYLKNFDRIIAFKFPAYYVEHGNKIIWLLHQFRQFYDLWDNEYGTKLVSDKLSAIRSQVIKLDNRFIPESRKIFTNSKIVSARLKKFNNIRSEILYPPLIDPEQYYYKEYGNYIFYPSRIIDSKRQLLLVESLRYTKTPVKALVAGEPGSIQYINLLKKKIMEWRLSKKVRLIDRWITESEKCKYYSECLGVAYFPYMEDSYGYVTMESFQSRKPVITLTDSGDTSFLVKHESTGFILKPEPRAIAKSIDSLYRQSAHAKELGDKGFSHMNSLGISWSKVVGKLTATY